MNNMTQFLDIGLLVTWQLEYLTKLSDFCRDSLTGFIELRQPKSDHVKAIVCNNIDHNALMQSNLCAHFFQTYS